MRSSSVGTYLRFLRKKTGLSQRELARILGSVSANRISRHERLVAPPTLLAAFVYQVVFQKPVSEIFPGLYHTVETAVEERLTALECELNDSSAKGRSAARIARQLEWLWERKNPESVESLT
jgi:transcriptional regulator with XRE-family HTH domain